MADAYSEGSTLPKAPEEPSMAEAYNEGTQPSNSLTHRNIWLGGL
jgi:hypothetical protein